VLITSDSTVMAGVWHLRDLQDQEITDILENGDDEVLGGDSDSDEEDQVEGRKEDSDSEESALSSDDEDDIPLSQRIDLLGRRKNYKWHLKEPMQSVRTRRCNIVVHLPGTRQPFTNRRTPTDTFLCFFTETMLDEIVKCSNLEIARVRENFERDRDPTDTNIVEMKAAIGLLLMAGVLKSSHCNTDELWGKHGPDIFRCTMSQRRFLFLMQCIRFDNKMDRVERRKFDKLAPIRLIFEQFNANCQKVFTVSEYTTVDEQLWAFRGRCGFRQYMKSKPARYGIKVNTLADSRSFYVKNMEIYCGQQPQGPFHVSNSPPDIVKRLVEPKKTPDVTSPLTTGLRESP